MRRGLRPEADEPTSPAGEMPQETQQAWARALIWFYDLFNTNYTRAALCRPGIRIGAGGGKLGEWDSHNRIITIAARHILEHPWERVLETLRHEMAHQYVDEVLRLPGVPPHGEAFAKACRILRVDPAAKASGADLGSLETSRDDQDRILARVKLLLALARSPNEHEAANAMRMANRYLLRYNLDLAQAETDRTYRTRFVGKCSSRIQEYEYTLANILQDHFFVQVIWTFSYDPVADRTGRILQVYGTPENLEMAEYVHHYVMHLAACLWAERRKATRRGGKLQYLAGLVRGLKEKLDSQKATLKEEEGLIWLGDSKLTAYYRHMNPYIRSTSCSGVSRGDRFKAGLKDGREITIHRGVGGSARQRGRMLEDC